MPRQTYSAVIEHTTETQFRAWGKQLSDALKACLVQTSDTGQIDWTANTAWITDSFTRANGAIGSASGFAGAPWTVVQGTAVIDTNQAKLSGVVAGGAAIVQSTGVGNGRIEVTIASAGTATPAIVFRGNSAALTQCYAWEPSSGGIYRYTSISARTAALISHTAFTPSPGDVLSLEWVESTAGPALTLKRNGTVIGTAGIVLNDTILNAANGFVGVRIASDATGALIDDFNWFPMWKPQTISSYVAYSTLQNYEMYRFDDALQATKPIFIKVEYGSGSLQSRPRIRISAGPGTNGAGTLTATYWTVESVNAATPVVTPVQTWACYKDGAFTLAWGMKATASAPCLIHMVERARDEAGVSTSEGIHYLASPTSGSTGPPSFAVWSLINNALVTGNAPPCLTPQSINSALGSIVNVYNWFAFTPNLKNLVGMFAYKNGEIPAWSEVDVAILGATPRHYVCLGNSIISSASSPGRAEDVIALLWEV